MPIRTIEASYFVKQPPTVDLVDGMFHICFDIGKEATFDIVMSPATFIKMRKSAGRVLDTFHEHGGNVAKLRKAGH